MGISLVWFWWNFQGLWTVPWPINVLTGFAQWVPKFWGLALMRWFLPDLARQTWPWSVKGVDTEDLIVYNWVKIAVFWRFSPCVRQYKPVEVKFVESTAWIQSCMPNLPTIGEGWIWEPNKFEMWSILHFVTLLGRHNAAITMKSTPHFHFHCCVQIFAPISNGRVWVAILPVYGHSTMLTISSFSNSVSFSLCYLFDNDVQFLFNVLPCQILLNLVGLCCYVLCDNAHCSLMHLWTN